jgi:hypothetical protein
MTCQGCGRVPENGTQTHYIGCDEAPKRHDPLRAALLVKLEESEQANQCAKDGCTNPRAVSRGPRPAKYCDEHKTGSKK